MHFQDKSTKEGVRPTSSFKMFVKRNSFHFAFILPFFLFLFPFFFFFVFLLLLMLMLLLLLLLLLLVLLLLLLLWWCRSFPALVLLSFCSLWCWWFGISFLLVCFFLCVVHLGGKDPGTVGMDRTGGKGGRRGLRSGRPRDQQKQTLTVPQTTPHPHEICWVRMGILPN